ncbi:RNA polymerase sigma-70 factor [Sphingobacterium sp. WM]|uniref:RNA polymerase sigma-70 factor n=1 Tax=Sphingobacterium sp. WM TaxID=3031802 RepID=UPI00240E2443|nr:RNA polymerase sigma-70 factor [Sphingobacterium sp. WM]WFB62105.1 RNA polymerase sigma-70 factor [Sphingobacterium sp. WM]
MVQRDEVAEDIATESLIILWEKMRTEEIQSVQSFLFKIIKNKSLDYLKHIKVRKKVMDEIDDWSEHEIDFRLSMAGSINDDLILSKEIREIALKTLEKLPSKTREVFMLSRQEQLKGNEIAEKMEMSLKGVEYHISKAIKALRISLKDYLMILWLFGQFLNR